MRLVEGVAGPVIEVASDRFIHPDGGEVFLMGAVHIADPAFYQVSVARLEAYDSVWVEGFVDDVEPVEDTPSGIAFALGLQLQGSVDVERPGWSRRDLAESDLQRLMRADGVPEEDVRGLLVSSPGTSKSPVPDTPRGVALARLRFMRDMATDDTSDLWKTYVIGRRDAHVAQGVASGDRRGIWYGADHLRGIGEGLHAQGWSHEERHWTPAIGVAYTELQLGPVQVGQLLDDWSE